jgi:hypothetical protein
VLESDLEVPIDSTNKIIFLCDDLEQSCKLILESKKQ